MNVVRLRPAFDRDEYARQRVLAELQRAAGEHGRWPRWIAYPLMGRCGRAALDSAGRGVAVVNVVRLRMPARKRREQPPTRSHPTLAEGFAERWYATVNAIRERRLKSDGESVQAFRDMLAARYGDRLCPDCTRLARDGGSVSSV